MDTFYIAIILLILGIILYLVITTYSKPVIVQQHIKREAKYIKEKQQFEKIPDEDPLSDFFPKEDPQDVPMNPTDVPSFCPLSKPQKHALPVSDVAPLCL